MLPLCLNAYACYGSSSVALISRRFFKCGATNSTAVLCSSDSLSCPTFLLLNLSSDVTTTCHQIRQAPYLCKSPSSSESCRRNEDLSFCGAGVVHACGIRSPLAFPRLCALFPLVQGGIRCIPPFVGRYKSGAAGGRGVASPFAGNLAVGLEVNNSEERLWQRLP